MANLVCDKCKKSMNEKEFYGTNNLEKYPTGKLNRCKKCLTMHVDNWDPETYLWILQECDVPYVPQEWYKCLETWGKDPSKVNGSTIIGRYLSKMKLVQYKKYRWKDTEFLQKKHDHEVADAMRRQGYQEAQIEEALDKQRIHIPEEGFKEPEAPSFDYSVPEPQYNNEYQYTSALEDTSSELGIELSDEEKILYRTKWGKSYKLDELVQLESLYQNMMNSYDVQGAGHEDILKLACKTSLKSNQLLDAGDIESAKKMVSMYDQLMKSGNFTAAQNKKDKGEFIDSISELVALCESEGFIPRFYSDSPKDRVDETILDMQGYVHSLVVDEMNLGNLIESAVREMTIQESKEEDEDIDDEILDLDTIEQIKDEDFEEFSDFIESEKEDDENTIANILKEGLNLT